MSGRQGRSATAIRAPAPKTSRRKKGDPPRSRFDALLDELGWSNRYLAERVKSTPAIVDRWALTGNAPPKILVWVEVLAALHRANPPPTDWRRHQ